MTTVYVIEGDLITRESRQVEQIGRLSDLLPTLTTYKPIEVGSLPRDCSYIHADSLSGTDAVEATVIVTQQPQTRRILFNESHGPESTLTPYRLAIPYHIFWLRMRGTPRGNGNDQRMVWAPQFWGTAWSRTPSRNIANDRWVAPGMPNTWRDGRVCFGNNPIDADQTLGQYIDGLVNTYWTSVFNTDLGITTPYGTNARTGLRRWEEATTSDPNCWAGWSIWGNETEPRQFTDQWDAQMWGTPMPDSVEPTLPMTPVAMTFHSIRRWLLEEFSDQQRSRLLWALTTADIETEPEPEPEPDPTTIYVSVTDIDDLDVVNPFASLVDEPVREPDPEYAEAAQTDG